MIDLSKVIGYSKDCLQSRALMRAVILDLYPGQTREMNVLLDVYESGIPREIRSAGTISDSQYAAYVQRIVNDYGLQEVHALEGLDAWIDQCIGVGTAAKIRKSTISLSSDIGENLKLQSIKHTPIRTQSIQNVSGSEADFDIKEIDTNSVEIVKFKGFDEKKMTVPSMIGSKKVIGIGKNAYRACKSLEKIIVAEGITYIENGAFAECTMLKDVILPSTLKRVGSKNSKNDFLRSRNTMGVFANTPIKHIIFPLGLTYLGRETFKRCSELEEINLPNGITQLEPATFKECSSLKKVLLPDHLRKIGDDAFMFCSKLEEIILPIAVRKLGLGAFNKCDMLKKVQLNEGLQEINSYAFYDCYAMTEITLPSTLSNIGSNVFGASFYDRLNLTIYCYAGSKGLEYARKEGFPIKDASKR